MKNDSYFSEQPPPTIGEIAFLRLAVTPLSYREIAKQLKLSLDAVSSYASQLFKKFNVPNRLDLALIVVRYGLISH